MVGSGLAGLCVARELRRLGNDVWLFEDPAHLPATSVAVGLLQVAGGRISTHHLKLRQACWNAYPSFLQSLGLKMRLSRHHRLAQSLASASGFASTLRGLGLEVEAASSETLRKSGLPLSGQAGEGAAVMEVGLIEPGKLLKALRSELNDLGVAWHRQRVERVEGTSLVDSCGKVWSGDAVVLACGAGLGRFWSPGWSLRLEFGEVSEFRGEHCLGDISVEAPWLEQLWVPKPNGWRSLGDAGSLLGLQGEELWRESGIRAFTPDGLPVVGEVCEGVYVLGALGRNGLLTAPLLAQTLAELICTGLRPGWLDSFVPSRPHVGSRRSWSR